MDRRRFLKYAGATAAVVGASALGLDYLITQNFFHPNITSPNGTATVSSGTTPTTFIQTTSRKLATMTGRLFFDRNLDGVQKEGEEGLPKARVVLRDRSTSQIIAEALSNSSGDYEMNEIPVGSYKLNIEADPRFWYLCRSTSDVSDISQGHDVVVGDDLSITLPDFLVGRQFNLAIGRPSLRIPEGQNILVNNGNLVTPQDTSKVDFGFAEGIFTLPFTSDADFTVDRYYDHDPSGRILWWNGSTSCLPKDKVCHMVGGTNNHQGIDYGMKIGTPIIAAAPGVVWRVQPERGGVIVRHTINVQGRPIYTSYNHMSRINPGIEINKEVKRGNSIGNSGDTNVPYPHLDFSFASSPNDAEFYALLDSYKPVVPVPNGFWLSNGTWTTEYHPANNRNWWSVFNDPQFFK